MVCGVPTPSCRPRVPRFLRSVPDFGKQSLKSKTLSPSLAPPRAGGKSLNFQIPSPPPQTPASLPLAGSQHYQLFVPLSAFQTEAVF